MKHLTLLTLLLFSPLSWGEEVYFCTLERKVMVTANNQTVESVNRQRIITVSEEQITVKEHGGELLGDFQRIPYGGRYIIARRIAKGDMRVEVSWFLDTEGLSLQRAVVSPFANASQWGRCTKL